MTEHEPFQLPDWGTEGAPELAQPPENAPGREEPDGEIMPMANERSAPNVTLTTTDSVPGASIVRPLRVVTATVETTHEDGFAGLDQAVSTALARLAARAEGAGAIVGIGISVSASRKRATVIAYGTAVELRS